MRKHKWKREIRQGETWTGSQSGESLFDLAKNLGKKAGEAALKKGAEKAGRKLAYVFSGKTSKTRNHKEKYLSEARTRS